MIGEITGADLRHARESRGWGLEKLARQVGVSKGHLSKVERGVDGREVTAKLVQSYKDVLRVPITPATPGVTSTECEHASTHADWPTIVDRQASVPSEAKLAHMEERAGAVDRAPSSPTDTVEAMRRRRLFATVAATVFGASPAAVLAMEIDGAYAPEPDSNAASHPMAPHGGAATGHRSSGEQAAGWLAWNLWQCRSEELPRSQVPTVMRHALDQHPHIMRTPADTYRFTDPALADVLVVRRLSADITQGDGRLLATAQTSHATDLALAALAADDLRALRGLTKWARWGSTAVARVNAAGILAKMASPSLGDEAISAIHADADTRQLYLTAVASRVLEMPWEEAAQLGVAASTPTDPAITLEPGRGRRVAERLSGELANPRDAAARWCSAVLLAALPGIGYDGTRAALLEAVCRESCRENLRAYAAVLAGANPVAV